MISMKFDQDDFCRKCGGAPGHGAQNCSKCDGEGGKHGLSGHGLDMRGEMAARDQARREKAEAEAQAYADDTMGDRLTDEERAEIAEWEAFLATKAYGKVSPQGEAYFQAIMECNRLGERPYPEWEDFAEEQS